MRVWSLRWRVTSDARSSARIRSFGVTASSPASRTVSIALVRFEKARRCSGVKPISSRQPLRSGPHCTPRRSVRWRCSSDWKIVPDAFNHSCTGLASTATKVPSARCTRLGTRLWTCSCGSPSRLVRCVNIATATPCVSTRRRTPWCCWRATAAWRSMKSTAVVAASTTAIDTSEATRSPPKAHSNDTDFGADSVRSIALTVRSRCPASRSTPVYGWLPSTRARRCSGSTTPVRPSSSAQRPCHTPGASPAPMK